MIVHPQQLEQGLFANMTQENIYSKSTMGVTHQTVLWRTQVVVPRCIPPAVATIQDLLLILTF